MKESEYKQDQISLLHGNYRKRMGGSDKGTLNKCGTCELQTCSDSQGAFEVQKREMKTVLRLFAHFLFLLLFDRCTCTFVPLMKRILLMLPPLACPLFHCLTTSSPFLFFIFVAHTYSECLVTLLPLDQSPGRRYQPPAHGQEPAGNHWCSCQFLLALHLCIAFCLADPGPSIIANTVLDTLKLNKCFLNEFIIHWEERTLSWENFLFRYLWIQIIYSFSIDLFDVCLNIVGV